MDKETKDISTSFKMPCTFLGKMQLTFTTYQLQENEQVTHYIKMIVSRLKYYGVAHQFNWDLSVQLLTYA